MCKKCASGQYGPFNKHVIGGANTHCWPCEAGLFSNSFGQASCKLCRGGKYQDEIGKPYCNSCPAGKFSPSMQDWFLKREKKTGQKINSNAHCTVCPLLERKDGHGKVRGQSHEESTFLCVNVWLISSLFVSLSQSKCVRVWVGG